MFEKATKNKFRYSSLRGNLTTEDLWDLPLTSIKGISLDDIAKQLNKELKENASESFVITKSVANDELETKFAIVKHIIKVRLATIAENNLAMQNKLKRDQILRLISEKKNDELRGKSIEELEAMINT